MNRRKYFQIPLKSKELQIVLFGSLLYPLDV